MGTAIDYAPIEAIGWAKFDPPVVGGQNGTAVLVFTTSEYSSAFVGPATTAVDLRFNVWLMTNDWDPTTLTWNNQPVRAGKKVSGFLTCSALNFSFRDKGQVLGAFGIEFVPEVGVTYYGVVVEISSATIVGNLLASVFPDVRIYRKKEA